MARLGHRKSRNGCVACKRRRVKCDEKHPCGACVRFGWQCSLKTAKHPPLPHVAASPSPEPAFMPPSGRESNSSELLSSHHGQPISSNTCHNDHDTRPASLPSPIDGSLNDQPLVSSKSAQHELMFTEKNHWLTDLELLHHYHTKTYLTFQRPNFHPELWQTVVPQIATRNDYLMHGLLAVSSLHLAYMQPSNRRRYYLISTHHQSLALAGFRIALQDVTAEHADAVFLASIFVSLFAFGSSAIKLMDAEESVDMRDVVELLVLVRGIEETLSAGRTRVWVRQGPVSSILRVPKRMTEGPDKSRSIFKPFLEEVGALIERSSKDYQTETTKPVSHAWVELERTYDLMLMEEPVLNSGYIMSWPNAITMDYLGLITRGNTLALILLAVFCSMLHYYEDRWVWNKWGAKVICLVEDALDPEWHEWLKLPKKIIEGSEKFRDRRAVDSEAESIQHNVNST